MGEYEKWNPLLRGVCADVPETMRLFAEVIDEVFAKRGLEIGPIGKYDGGIAWSVSDASPVMNLEERQETERDCLKELLKDEESWKAYLADEELIEDEKTKEVHILKDRKLVVSFRVPKVTPEMVTQLKGLYIDYRLWGDETRLRDGVDVGDPHPYIDVNLRMLDERVAGRFVGDMYQNVIETAMWFSAEKNGDSAGHWLYDADDVLVELRISPNQEFMETAEMVLQMAYILSGKEGPGIGETFLDVWHTLLPKLIDEYFIRNERMPGQERVFNRLMTHCLLPYFDDEYAAKNKFRPYNAMIFGPKGTGKTMLAAMLALTRFDGGVVIPVSQQFLLKDDMELLDIMDMVEMRTGIKVVPIFEDLDALASLSSEGDEGASAKMANSDIANLLAGMGEQRLLVIGIGNNPELMDPNLLDPERLGGMLFYLGLPDDEERKGLIRNLAEARGFDERTRDSLVEYLTPKTEDFSHRMIVDVFNRAVPEAAEARIEGIPAPEDFRGVREDLTAEMLDAALDYCKTKHNFEHLRETAKRIEDWFDRLGYRPEGTMGYRLPRAGPDMSSSRTSERK